LLVYSLTEWMVRAALKANDFTVRDQNKKQTHKPTVKWIFFIFRRVYEIQMSEDEKPIRKILNYTDELRKIAK